MEEIFKDIPGYEGLYQCSNIGRVKSLNKKENSDRDFFRPEKILSQSVHRDGYLKTVLAKNRTPKTLMTHRLVALSFIPNPENKKQVNHKNGIKSDNRLENLEWCTPKENSRHAHNTGLKHGVKGEKNHFARLTEDVVVEIRAKYEAGETISFLSESLGLKYEHIHKIIKRHRWKHI